MTSWVEMRDGMKRVLEELIQAGRLKPGSLIVIGASTSEMRGQRIGTAGAEDCARAIVEAAMAVKESHGVDFAFQCCEHLNRALVVERSVLERKQLEEVTVVPVPEAGGSMAAYAFRHLADPAVAETVLADAGVDVGGTLIGMHLRRVAVPFRPSVSRIGEAQVIAAYTRPKLIGGARAKYER
jgi:uncharacterized protein (TIGR01440 family)